MCTTSYFPKLLVANIEKEYSVLDPRALDQNETYFIHVLGGGYDRLPMFAVLASFLILMCKYY